VLGQILRIVLFLAFVALGLRIPLSAAASRRRAIHAFLAFVLVTHTLTIAAQVDGWPLSTYPMMANDTTAQPHQQHMIVIVGVDARGREGEADPLAWSPLYLQSMRGWFENVYAAVPSAERASVGHFLLRKAEAARAARAAGARFGNERWLGPLAAPDTYGYPPPRVVPADPFTGLRVYRVSWDRRDLLQGEPAVARLLVFEHPEP
jgi:hypothetical protein